MVRHMVLVCFLAMAAIWDYRANRIPNRLIGSMLLAGFLLNGVLAESGVNVVFGMLFPFFGLYLLFRMRVLGAGDIKLLCASGAYLGVQVVWLVGISLLLCAATGFILLLRRGVLGRRLVGGVTYLLTLLQGRCFVPYRYGLDSEDCISIPFSLCILTASGIVMIA